MLETPKTTVLAGHNDKQLCLRKHLARWKPGWSQQRMHDAAALKWGFRSLTQALNDLDRLSN